jgi:hypothetical protein
MASLVFRGHPNHRRNCGYIEEKMRRTGSSHLCVQLFMIPSFRHPKECLLLHE